MYVEEVEHDISNIYGGYTVAVNSGTSALLAALVGVGVRPGDKVIVPALTFAAPAFAVQQLGAEPVFADINTLTWNIDVNTIEHLIDDRTTAIIVVHLYGLPANMPLIMELAKKYNLRVIEDCAEAFMASIDGQYVGSFGHAGIFSFQKSKHVSCGNGGAAIFSNADYARRARRFAELGYSTLTATGSKGTRDVVQHPNFNRHYSMGFNFRLPELCAEALVYQLDVADHLVEQRTEAAAIFKQAVGTQLKGSDQYIPKGYEHTYWTYAFKLPQGVDREHQIAIYETFRKVYLHRGGDPFYAAWRVVSHEPHFKREGYHERYATRVALSVQPRLVCLNTGVKKEAAEKEAEILNFALRMTR